MCQDTLKLDPVKYADCTRKMFEDVGATPDEVESQAKAAYDRAIRKEHRTHAELTHKSYQTHA
jgi:hypothetical protein